MVRCGEEGGGKTALIDQCAAPLVKISKDCRIATSCVMTYEGLLGLFWQLLNYC